MGFIHPYSPFETIYDLRKNYRIQNVLEYLEYSILI